MPKSLGKMGQEDVSKMSLKYLIVPENKEVL